MHFFFFLADEDKLQMKQALIRLNHQLTSSPQDLFEWRLANRRMFGWLQIMLSGSPRLLLLYLKYFHHDVENRAYFRGFRFFNDFGKTSSETTPSSETTSSSETMTSEEEIKETDDHDKSSSLQNEADNHKMKSIFFSLNVDTQSNALNRVVADILYTMPEYQFWLQWLFLPQLPFYSAIRYLNFQYSYLDEIIKFMIIFRFAMNAVEVYVLLITYNFAAFAVGNILYECGNFIAAWLYYHVFWFLFPSYLHDWLFYFSIFVLIPNFTFFSIFSLLSLVDRQVKKSAQIRIERSTMMYEHPHQE